MNGKGSTPRRVDKARFDENFDRIFARDERKWGYAYRYDDELWRGFFDTRQEALEEAVACMDGSDRVALCRGRQPRPSEALSRWAVDSAVDAIIEGMQAFADDEWDVEGQGPDDWPRGDALPERATEQLAAYIARWVDEHVAPIEWYLAEDQELVSHEEVAVAHARVCARDPDDQPPKVGQRWHAVVDDDGARLRVVVIADVKRDERLGVDVYVVHDLHQTHTLFRHQLVDKRVLLEPLCTTADGLGTLPEEGEGT